MTEPHVASPLDEATARVGDRWTLLLVQALLDGPRRFNELLEALPGIAPNVLSQRLKHLERERVLVGQPYSRRPRFAYELTADGRELAGALRLLAQWGADRSGAPDPGSLRHLTCGTPWRPAGTARPAPTPWTTTTPATYGFCDATWAARRPSPCLCRRFPSSGSISSCSIGGRGPRVDGRDGGRKTGRHEARDRPSPLRHVVPGPTAGRLRPGRPLCPVGRVGRLLPALGLGPLLVRPGRRGGPPAARAPPSAGPCCPPWPC